MTNKELLYNAMKFFNDAGKNLERILEEEYQSDICLSDDRSMENLKLRRGIIESCNNIIRYWLDHYQTEEEG